MEKQELLDRLKQATDQGLINKDEVMSLFEVEGSESNVAVKSSRHINIPTIFSYIGGAIVFIGLMIYFAQLWSDMTDLIKILVTFGVGLIFYVVGLIFYREERFQVASYGLLLVGFGLIAGGLYVIIQVAGISVSESSFIYLVVPPLMMTFISAVSLAVFRHNFFMLMTIVFSTLLYYGLVAWIVKDLSLFNSFWFYISALQGATWVFVAYVFAYKNFIYQRLSGLFYAFGSLIFLGAALSLANAQVGWLWVYPSLIILAVFLSVRWGSRSILTFGSLFLIAYVSLLTRKYFADSVGWPIALIIIGISIIAIALISIQINKKFLSK